MMIFMKSRGAKLALLTAVCVFVTLSLAVWLGWEHIRFYWLFEPLGNNKQGIPEYRHRQTGLIFIQIQGGHVSARQTTDDAIIEDPPETVTVAPFLISKDVMTGSVFYQVVPPRIGFISGWGPTSIFYPTFPEDLCREFCDKASLTIPTKLQWDVLKLTGDPCPQIWLQYPDGIYVSPSEEEEQQIETTQGVINLRLPKNSVIEFRPAYPLIP